MGEAGLRYNLYCPIDALQLDTSGHVYRKLRDYLVDREEEWRQVKTAGLWLSRDLPATLSDLLNSSDPTVCTWVLFVLEHFFEEKSDKMLMTEVIFRNSSAHSNVMLKRRIALFERDPSTIEHLRNSLIEKGARKKQKALHTFSDHGYRPSIRIELKFPTYEYVNRFDGPKP